MTIILQILFFVFLGIVYGLGFLLVWLGIFPQDRLADLCSRWSLLAPVLAVLAPFVAFTIFALGYDPRTAWAQRARQLLLPFIQTGRPLKVTLGCLAGVIVLQSLLVHHLFSRPEQESHALLMAGDFDRAMEVSGARGPGDADARIVWLVSQAEMEAKRRGSTSDNLTEIEAMRQELPSFDRSFSPLWSRFYACYGMGKLAFCRQDAEAVEEQFAHASLLATWIDGTLTGKCSRASAQALFSLSQSEPNPEKAGLLMGRARSILNKDTSIQSQRLLGSMLYLKGDYGGAFRTWKAVLDRTESDKARGLVLPDANEKKRLLNNMALSHLKQAQPSQALLLVERGLTEAWHAASENDRTEQTRLMATKIFALVAMGRPSEAIAVFEARAALSVQISSEGLTSGSLLLKANILAAIWKDPAQSSAEHLGVARQILDCLLLAQDPARDTAAFSDHSPNAYRGLVTDVKTLWRWEGISFDQAGCEAAILGLLPGAP